VRDVRARRRGTLAAFACALLLYLPAVDWGTLDANRADVVRGWGVDDETPLGTLSELSGIRKARPDRNLGYPLMHPLMLGAVYAPYLGMLYARGEFRPGPPSWPYGLAEPRGALRTLALLSHLLSALLAAGIVACAFDIGAELWGRRAGFLGAAVTAVMFPLFYYARTGNVDVPALFFVAVAYAAFARILNRGLGTQSALFLGAAVGFAVATKEPMFAAFLALPIVVVALHAVRVRRQGGGAATFLRPPLLALGACALAFGLGSGLFIDPERFLAHVAFAQERVSELAAGEIASNAAAPMTLAGNLSLARVIGGQLAGTLTEPGLAIAFIGILIALRRRPLAAALALPALTYLTVLFFVSRASELRYVLPAALSLAPFAGRAIDAGLDSGQRMLRAGAATALVAVVGLGLLRGADLTWEMLRDSRHDAAQWLQLRAQEGQRLAFFGADQNVPVVPAVVALARANVYHGAVRTAATGPDAVADIRNRWHTERPDYILIMPDHSSPPGVPHSASCPPAIYDALVDGSLGYRLGADFRTARLLPWLPRPALDYPTVNPPIRIFVPAGTT
jgi:hypothetical protein